MRAFLLWIVSAELEAVTDAECDVTPMEIGFGDDVEARTDVQRELDRHCGEFVFETGLANETEGDFSVNTIEVIVPVTQTGTNASIPTETFGDFTSPLVNTGEAESCEFVFKIQTKVDFETIATQTFLEGEFSTVTLTTAETNTQCVVLCICSCCHCEDSCDN